MNKMIFQLSTFMSFINFISVFSLLVRVLLQELSGVSFLKIAILFIIIIIGNFSKKHLVLVQMHVHMEKV